MKIGIVTFHFAQNYGALLQCFALKTYLQKLNSGEVNIINYCPEYHYAEYRQSNPAFDNFIDTRISAIDYTEDDDYDVIIYGSDTIWHPFKFKTFEGFDEAYFAKKFKSKKHISFSASSCLEPLKKSEEKQPKISELLRNFSSISVRESFLADFIAECVDIPVHHTCDPTFLLSAEEWSGYLSEPIIKEPYIFVYNQQFGRSIYDIIDTFTKNNNFDLPVFLIDGRGSYLRERCGRIIRKDINPFDFVSLIKNAEYVYISSFHGCAFSAIFQRQFGVSCRWEFNRVQSFVNLLGLQDRFASHSEYLDYKTDIDWQAVSPLLDDHIQKSKDYLIKSIGGNLL